MIPPSCLCSLSPTMSPCDLDQLYSDDNEGSIITSLISQLRHVVVYPYLIRSKSLTISLSSSYSTSTARVHLHPESEWIYPKSPSQHSFSSRVVCWNASQISCPILTSSSGKPIPSHSRPAASDTTILARKHAMTQKSASFESYSIISRVGTSNRRESRNRMSLANCPLFLHINAI
jgi:hypothetical protein